MLLRHTQITIKELAEFLGKQPRTIRSKLRKLGFLSRERLAGREYVIDEGVARAFISQAYPQMMTDFLARNTLDMDVKQLLDSLPIPTTKGKIKATNQKSGNTYFYIKELPLYITREGQAVYYKGPGYSRKEDAEQKRRELIIERSSGMFKRKYTESVIAGVADIESVESLRNKSFYDCCQELFEKQHNHCAATSRDYMAIINTKVRDFFKGITVARLNLTFLQAYLDAQTGNIKRHMTIITQTVRDLYQRGLIPGPWHERLRKPKITVERNPKRALLPDEVMAIRKAVSNHGWWWIIELLLATGMRFQEAQALSPEDIEIIDHNRGVVYVRKAWGLIDKGVYGRKSTKTVGSVRSIPFINKDLVTMIEALKADSKHQDYLMVNKCGTGPIDVHNFNRFLRTVAKDANLTRLSSHFFRHTYISTLLHKRVPVTSVAELTGDSVETIMRVYAHDVAVRDQQFEYVSGLYEESTVSVKEYN